MTLREKKRAPENGPPATVGEWYHSARKRLQEAALCYDNGLQNAAAEAEYLVCHLLKLPFEEADQWRRQPADPRRWPELLAWLDTRINQRLPVPYITREAFFAGHRFYVDQRVLIPRSRIENLFDLQGRWEWPQPGRVQRVLDLCTGCGCLALSLALALPKAQIDGADISPEALAVATENRRRLGLEKRVHWFTSDLFAALSGERYDLIVTNPPYVADPTYRALPPEYQREPALALRAGQDGLELILTILDQAADHLTPRGVLICETGDESENNLIKRFPDFPGEWIPFHFGSSGVFAINQKQLSQWRKR